MHKLNLLGPKESLKILCLGAHSDDIEIGCGGTILRLLKGTPEAEVYWLVFSAKGERAKEAHKSAASFLSQAKSKTIDVQNFRDSYFPFVGAEIKDYLEKIRKSYSPDIVFTHFGKDAHQDHRLVSELTWNTYRNNFIVEYEIAKYDGDLVTPNLYSHLDAEDVERKIDFIYKFFSSQKDKTWFSKEMFSSLMKIRGLESNSPSGYAEAFHCRKIVF